MLASVLVAAAALGCREDAEPPTAPQPAPALDGALTQTLAFRQVSAEGVGHTCGVTTDSIAYCWGRNQDGQLGNGTSRGPEVCGEVPCSSRPVRVVGGLTFRTVDVGGGHTCALTMNDVVYCWGHNFDGQLGSGATTGPQTCRPFFGEIPCSRRPVRVAGRLNFRQLDAGLVHTCGVTTNHAAYCWGNNLWGQLGNGNRTGPETCFFGNPCSTRPLALAARP